MLNVTIASPNPSELRCILLTLLGPTCDSGGSPSPIVTDCSVLASINELPKITTSTLRVSNLIRLFGIHGKWGESMMSILTRSRVVTDIVWDRPTPPSLSRTVRTMLNVPLRRYV